VIQYSSIGNLLLKSCFKWVLFPGVKGVIVSRVFDNYSAVSTYIYIWAGWHPQRNQ
jgi:hypothetical protein